MKFKGILSKMAVENNKPVSYFLRLGEDTISLNEYLGRSIQLCYQGNIYCIQCSRQIRKSFQQGFCFPCYRRLLECNLCIIRPERCRYYEGVCQPDDWAHAHCNASHVVYLANSSGIKVGITRKTHIPSRWIDQGATQGLVIAQTKNRYLAGLIEVALKQYVADKTKWHAMLKGDNSSQDLFKAWTKLFAMAEKALFDIQNKFFNEIEFAAEELIVDIEYPMVTYPSKIKAFDLDKQVQLGGQLLGMKGQYLILDTGVLSVRKYGGYEIEFHA